MVLSGILHGTAKKICSTPANGSKTLDNFWKFSDHWSRRSETINSIQHSGWDWDECWGMEGKTWIPSNSLLITLKPQILPFFTISFGVCFLNILLALWLNSHGFMKSLTHFRPVSHFYGILTFSRGIEMWHWTKTVNNFWRLIFKKF